MGHFLVNQMKELKLFFRPRFLRVKIYSTQISSHGSLIRRHWITSIKIWRLYSQVKLMQGVWYDLNSLLAQSWLLSNKPSSIPWISDDLLNITCLGMTQDMRMKGTRIGRLPFLLSTTAIMIVNVHLQLSGSTAAQTFPGCLQLQIFEEPIVHVLCSN